MKIRARIMCLALIAAAFSGCGLFLTETIEGSAATTALSLDNNSFTRIEVSDACRATIDQGAEYSVAITINQNLAHYVKVEETAGTLRIGLDPSKNYSHLDFSVVITLPTIEAVTADDASNVTVTGFTTTAGLTFTADDASSLALSLIAAPRLTIIVRDASRLSGDIACAEFSLTVTDASQALLSGTAEQLSLISDDAAAAGLTGLESVHAVVRISDASEARINTTGSISGSVTDASRLFYTGNPLSVNVTVKNASRLEPFF